MSLLFLSPDLSTKAQNYIKSNVFKFNGYITSNQDDADLIVCNNICFLKSSTITIPRISFLCFKSMVEDDINPFTFQYKTKALANLYFRNKTFMFYQTSPQKVYQCTQIIELMCGTIKSEDADYCLTEKQDQSYSKQLISLAWIYALQHSSLYIPPDSYIISKKINCSQPKKKVSSKKSTFPGQLQICCSDKPECPIFPRITSQQTKSQSQFINPGRRGELTLFTCSSNMDYSPKLDKYPFTQCYSNNSIGARNKKSKFLNAQTKDTYAKYHQALTQNFKLCEVFGSNNHSIKSIEKNESNEINNYNNNLNNVKDIGIDFLDELTSFSQVVKSDDEDNYSNDVHYDAKNENVDETDSDVTCSQDPIMLAFSKY